jgi:hypothetical protein
MRRYVDKERTNLDLNGTCRKKAKDLVSSSLYMDQTSSLKVNFHLSFPIKVYAEDSPTKLPQTDGVADPTDMEYELLRASQKLALHKECLPYERQVYIFAYKNAEFLKELQAAILDINIEILFPDGGTVRDIRTAMIDDAQREDTSYDFIGGVQIIDVNFRVFILESCSNGALQQLGARLPKANQNSDAFKIIRNEKLSFYKRMYLDFNIDTKRVKLRKSIKRLVDMPDIYLRERVPIETYNTIMKVKRLREKWTLEDIINSNLWLTGEELVVLERNYGDA